jgi:hypothetical protein
MDIERSTAMASTVRITGMATGKSAPKKVGASRRSQRERRYLFK